MRPEVRTESDDCLMRKVRDGDRGAFAELYDRHAGRAFRVARAVCRDVDGAEDAVQAGFLAIWRSRASYREGSASFQAWAMKIVQKRAIDSARRAAEGERDAMLESLRLLPAAQAEVIVLAFYGELSHSEIAAQLELAPGTVKGRMRLGLEELRRAMAIDEG